METIFALASARGRSGVAVLRLSGPQAFAAAEEIAGPLPVPRHAALRRLRHAGIDIDTGLVLCFEAGASFTGEPVVELQVHGSPAVVAKLLAVLGGMEGLRPAEPGEFTRRALENERMDLAQVEGLGDLISSETEAQRAQALRIMSGALGHRVDGWQRKLVRMSALVEATIDFVEEDVPIDIVPEVGNLLAELRSDLAAEIAGYGAAERIRDGFEVAIVGAPNTGKSTLLNALAGREAALTSSRAGTTRDVIEVRMDIGGLPVTLLDTAGLRETADEVERMGVDRARARALGADLRVFLTTPEAGPVDLPAQAEDLVVAGKADVHGGAGLAVSGLTGAGLDGLVSAIADRLGDRVAGAGVAVRARHRNAMQAALVALDRADVALSGAGESEILAEELRKAARDLDTLVGRIDVEHILGEIFSAFCIGK